MNKLIVSLSFFVSLVPNLGFAQDDGAFLDPQYQVRNPPLTRSQSPAGFDALPVRSDVDAVIAQMTPVKAQASRGTCSIFSAVALLEGSLVREFQAPLSTDLSEEWLEYLITRETGMEGSWSYRNFEKLRDLGAPREDKLPYIGETWSEVIAGTLSEVRCGLLSGFSLTTCLLGHRNGKLLTASDADLLNPASSLYDPEFQLARAEAAQARDLYTHKIGNSFSVGTESSIKALLNRGIPLTWDADFYYGAWNHRKAESLSIPRNLNHWAKGIVGYPAPGSMDRRMSPTDPAGHSIVIVGYDDALEVTVPTLMADGTTKNFTYTGVYYFKNSWGVDNFGTDTVINGVVRPGYGMVTQKYAHEFGSFYKMPFTQ